MVSKEGIQLYKQKKVKMYPRMLIYTHFGSTRTGDFEAIGRAFGLVLRRKIPGMKAPRPFFLDEDGSSSLLSSEALSVRSSGDDTKLHVWASVVDVTLEGIETM